MGGAVVIGVIHRLISISIRVTASSPNSVPPKYLPSASATPALQARLYPQTTEPGPTSIASHHFGGQLFFHIVTMVRI